MNVWKQVTLAQVLSPNDLTRLKGFIHACSDMCG